MNRSILAIVLMAAVAVPATSRAQDAAKPDPAGWTGTGELGLAIAKGNTDSRTLIGKLGISRDDGAWKHAGGVGFLYAQSNDIKSAQRYEVFGSSGRRLSERSYVFASARHERDDFGTHDSLTTLAGGYGYEAIKTEPTQWTLEIGPGYRWATLNVTGRQENDAIVRGMSDFKHAFNAQTALYNLTVVEAGRHNTFLRNDTGLLVKMTDALALKAGIEVRHNTDVLPGKKKTDTLSTVNIVYGF